MSAPVLERALSRLGVRGEVLANTSWQLADRGLRLVVGFLVGVWMVRYLGPESFGRLSYALAWVALLYPIANLGLDPIVVRELVSRPAAAPEIMGSAFGLKLLGGVAALAAIAIAAPLLEHDRALAALIVVAGVVLPFQALDVVECWFQSRLEAFRVVVAKNVALLAVSALRIALILGAFSLIAFAWAGVAEVALAAAAMAVAYLVSGASLRRWRFTLTQARALLRDGWPFIFSNAMIMIYMRIDQLMLGRMAGPGELGMYSVAVRLTEVWYVLAMAVVSSVFPAVVRAREQSEDVFHGKLQRLYSAMALVGYGVAVPIALLAGPLVTLAFGDAYRPAVPMLQIMIWTVLFTSLGVARSAFLTAMNWTGLHLVTVAAGAVVNVALNLVLIPRLGGVGAAIATLISYALAAYGSCVFDRRLFATGRMLTRAIVTPWRWPSDHGARP